jgi:hypothetical protein
VKTCQNQEGYTKTKMIMIVVLAGRRVDAKPEDNRFPLKNVNDIENKITDVLSTLKPAWLISSGACGADLIALKAAGRLKIARKMILPFSAEKFRETSVVDRPGNWGILFDEICAELRKSDNLVELGFDENDEKSYLDTNTEIFSQAGRLMDTVIVTVVVWDQTVKEQDATNHFRLIAVKKGLRIVEINSVSLQVSGLNS